MRLMMPQCHVALQAGYVRHNYEAWTRGEISAPNLATLFDYAQVLGIRFIVVRS